MALSLSIRTVVSGIGETIDKTVTIESSGHVLVDEQIGAGQSNVELNVDFTLAALFGIVIDTDEDLTLETNDAGSPQETIAIKANKPLVWLPGIGLPALFGGAVTKIFATNAGANPARLQMRIPIDATP